MVINKGKAGMIETKTETKVTKATKVKTDKQKNTGMAVVAYILFFVPLLTDAKDDPFVKYHVKQSIVLLILIVGGWIIGIIPILGWILALLLPIFEFVLLVIGIINAVNGQEKPLPLIGQFADKINI